MSSKSQNVGSLTSVSSNPTDSSFRGNGGLFGVLRPLAYLLNAN